MFKLLLALIVVAAAVWAIGRIISAVADAFNDGGYDE